MPKRKPVELVETINCPTALIIGEGFLTNYLSSSLKEQGCEVKVVPSGRFDYIFQFGNFELLDKIKSRHLKTEGKYLFIEQIHEENIKAKEGIKILRIGNPNLWNCQDLTSKILKALFSQKTGTMVDLRKKPYFIPKKTQAVKIPSSPPLVIKKRHLITKKRLLMLLLIFVFLILGAAGTIYWFGLSMQNNISQFQSHMASSNWEAATADIAEAKQKLVLGRNIYNSLSTIFFPFKDVSVVKDTGILLSSSSKLLDSGEDLISFFQKSSFSKSGFTTQEGGISKLELTLLEDKLNYLGNAIVEARDELENIHSPFFPKESFTTFLSIAADKLVSARETFPLIEKFLFNPNPQTYLVLFQNNMELRPTGGFIGSYGLLTLDRGKMSDFKIEDVYTADGQLKGHVEPPTPIRKYLSQPHFFLRDSNFDPDFAASAAKAAWFLEKELNIKVDGVIGINMSLVQKLLRVLGPLTLSDFGGDEINSDNFFYKAQTYAQEKFFPGSTKKKDFLTSVANNILLKLTVEKKGVAYLEVLPIIKQSLEEKNILLFAYGEDLQKMIEEKGYGGRMVEVKCAKTNNYSNGKNCLSDYLSAVEANLGVNKANYFVGKTVTVEKKIGKEGIITSIVTLAYENSGTPEVLLSATYVNYLRLFVPAGSKLISVTLNNVPLSSADIDTDNYGPDKSVFGFLVKIAPENKGIVKVTYTLPLSISSAISSYQFFFQKQAGDKLSPILFSLTFPSETASLKALNFTSTAGRNDEVFYATDTSVDRIFALEVSR